MLPHELYINKSKTHTHIKVKSIKPGDYIQYGCSVGKIIDIQCFAKSQTRLIFENGETRVWNNTDWAIKYLS